MQTNNFVATGNSLVTTIKQLFKLGVTVFLASCSGGGGSRDTPMASVSSSSSAVTDITAPIAQITSPISGWITQDNTIVVRGTASDDRSGIASVAVNGTEVTTSDHYANWQVTVPLTTFGSTNLAVATRDTAGNTNSSAAKVNIIHTTIGLTLSWQENFNQLDTSRWDVQLYSFPANGCNMVEDHVLAKNNTLSLLLDLNQSPTDSLPKMCNAGEIGSLEFFTYGLFVVKMQPPAIPGGVTAFFLMNQWEAQNWEHREIDIEVLGKNTSAVQFTTHDFQNGGLDWKSAPATLDLSFDASLAFHEYAILWTDSAVYWYVDRRMMHTEILYVPQVPLQIRMNTYLGDPTTTGVTTWLGPIDASKLPVSAYYQQIEYYPLDALPASYIN